MIPASAVADARAAQAQTGASDTAAALALAVAGPETGYSYDPGAAGDYMLDGRIVPKGTPGAIPTSFGYTQLHTADGGDGGGLGDGYSTAQLLDPVQNFAIAMRNIQAALNNGATPYDAIQPWSTRDTAINGLSDALAALGAAPESAGAGGSTGARLSGGLVALGAGALVVIWLLGD
ncbi:MAG: hypothetical protein M1582_00625 [Actinobacteria bacterium]|nr:hypothetical protein [Actinomycetota bacterium]